MRRATWIGVLATGGLMIAGCSSTSGNPPSLSAASSSAAANSSAVAMSNAAGPVTPLSSVQAVTGSSAAAAVLDPQTTAWFETVCGGLGPSLSSINSLDQTSTTNPAAAQAAAVTALQSLQTAFSSTATTLASAPPPTFDGGSAFAANLTAGLASAADQLGPVAAKFATVNAGDTGALSAAAAGLQVDLATALEPLDSINQLNPAISTAVGAIPSCQALGS